MRRGMMFIILLLTISFTILGKIGLQADVTDTIPEDSVRLRIIANSNSEIDQKVKQDISNKIISYIEPKIRNITNSNEAKQIIYNHVEDLNQIVNLVLQEHNLKINYYVDYGLTKFPTKVYQDKIYQAGKYEAIYIVLGEGKGDNFWCVLFPPLCLVDVNFKDGEVRETKTKYSFYFFDKLKELFMNK